MGRTYKLWSSTAPCATQRRDSKKDSVSFPLTVVVANPLPYTCTPDRSLFATVVTTLQLNQTLCICISSGGSVVTKCASIRVHLFQEV